jgi:hypothetical protein
MKTHTILGVHITDRVQRAKDVQAVFTEFGCNIKTRLGLHDVTEESCAPGGLILLELYGDPKEFARMESRLRAITGVQVQKMEFAA